MTCFDRYRSWNWSDRWLSRLKVDRDATLRCWCTDRNRCLRRSSTENRCRIDRESGQVDRVDEDRAASWTANYRTGRRKDLSGRYSLGVYGLKLRIQKERCRGRVSWDWKNQFSNLCGARISSESISTGSCVQANSKIEWFASSTAEDDRTGCGCTTCDSRRSEGEARQGDWSDGDRLSSTHSEERGSYGWESRLRNSERVDREVTGLLSSWDRYRGYARAEVNQAWTVGQEVNGHTACRCRRCQGHSAAKGVSTDHIGWRESKLLEPRNHVQSSDLEATKVGGSNIDRRVLVYRLGEDGERRGGLPRWDVELERRLVGSVRERSNRTVVERDGDVSSTSRCWGTEGEGSDAVRSERGDV